MQYLPPMSEESLRAHKGKRVCAVMLDGSRYYGTISDVKDGHLILNGPGSQNATVNHYNKNKSKSKTKTKIPNTHSPKKTKGASVSAFYPGYGYGGYGYGYGAGLALSLGLLALLFLI